MSADSLAKAERDLMAAANALRDECIKNARAAHEAELLVVARDEEVAALKRELVGLRSQLDMRKRGVLRLHESEIDRGGAA